MISKSKSKEMVFWSLVRLNQTNRQIVNILQNFEKLSRQRTSEAPRQASKNHLNDNSKDTSSSILNRSDTFNDILNDKSNNSPKDEIKNDNQENVKDLGSSRDNIKKTTLRKWEGGWRPTKKLSRDQMEQLRFLNQQLPETHGISRLSKMYGISVEAVVRILKSKFVKK